MKKFALFLLGFVPLSFSSYAMEQALWIDLQAKSSTQSVLDSIAYSGKQMAADQSEMQRLFSDKSKSLDVLIPLPTGEMVNFRLTPKSVMAPALAAKFPELMSYVGVQTGQPDNKGRFNISSQGLSGMFLYNGEWVFMSPQGESENAIHVSYYRKDAIAPEREISSEGDYLVTPQALAKITDDQQPAARTSGDQIRTYRLAISTAAEYTQRLNGLNGVMAELDRLVNRVNQILLADLSVQFELVANNDQLIFTNAATDPFTNDDGTEDIQQNQTTLDDIIGSGNYDIGHHLNTNGGGLAFVGVACNSRFKGQGYTGSRNPMGERFYIDLVIHEFGHQLGASHTFNAIEADSCSDGDEGQRSNSSSVEPGSGSTIMGYAGICRPQNLQNDSDPYFHAWSIRQARNHIDNGTGRICGTLSDPENGIPQIADGVTQYAIPANTPFILSAVATDDNPDQLTYGWDQIDAGGTTGGTATLEEISQDNGQNPLFRSFTPTTDPARYFPRLSDVLNDTTQFGETYPTTNRTLNFEVVVRDNVGGVDTQQVAIEVVTSLEPFEVIQPGNGDRWIGGTTQSIIWNTANTTQAPISCNNVDILLDVDGDEDFNTVLASATSNSGSADVSIPNAVASGARLMVKCSDNVFYALNPGSFSIESGENPIAPLITGQQDVSVDEDGSIEIRFEDVLVNDPDTNYPDGFSLTISDGVDYQANNQTVTPATNFNGQLSVNLSVNDGTTDSNIFPFLITVNSVNDGPIATDDSGSVSQNSPATTFSVLSNDSDPDGDTLTISSFEYTGTGVLTQNGDLFSYTPATGFSGTDSINYTITDAAGINATATLTITVTAAPTAQPPSSGGGGSDSGGGTLIWLLSVLFASLGIRSTYVGVRNQNGQII